MCFHLDCRDGCFFVSRAALERTLKEMRAHARRLHFCSRLSRQTIPQPDSGSCHWIPRHFNSDDAQPDKLRRIAE